MYRFDANGQLTMLELEVAEGTGAPPKRRPGKPDSELVSIPYFHLDLVSGSVDLFGQRHWDLRSPWRKGKRPLNTGAAPPYSDPSPALRHTGGKPGAKVLSVESRLHWHPAPSL